MSEYNVKVNFLSGGAKQDVETLSASIKRAVDDTKKSLESQGVGGKEMYSILSKQLDLIDKQTKSYSNARMAMINLKNATNDWNNSVAKATSMDWANKVEARTKVLREVIRSTKADLEATLVAEPAFQSAGATASEKANRAKEREEARREREEKKRERLERAKEREAEKQEREEEKERNRRNASIMAVAKGVWDGIDKVMSFAGRGAQTVAGTRNASYMMGDMLQFVPWFGGALSTFSNKALNEYMQMEQSGMKLRGIGGGKYFQSWGRYDTSEDYDDILGGESYVIKKTGGDNTGRSFGGTNRKRRGWAPGYHPKGEKKSSSWAVDASDLSKEYSKEDVHTRDGKDYVTVETDTGEWQTPFDEKGNWRDFTKKVPREFEVEKVKKSTEILSDIESGGLEGIAATIKAGVRITGKVFESIFDSAKAGMNASSLSDLGVKNADLFERAYLMGRGAGRFGGYGKNGQDGFVEMAKESYFLERAWQITPQTMQMMASVSQMTRQSMVTQTSEIARVIRLTDPTFGEKWGWGYFDKYAEISNNIAKNRMDSLISRGAIDATQISGGIGIARAMGYQNPDQMQKMIGGLGNVFGGGGEGSAQKALQYYALSKAGVKDKFQADILMQQMKEGVFTNVPAEFFRHFIDTIEAPAGGNVDVMAATISSASGGAMTLEAARDLIVRKKMGGSFFEDIVKKIQSGEGITTRDFSKETKDKAYDSRGMGTKQDSDWNEGLATAGKGLMKDFTNLSMVIKDIIKAWGKSNTSKPKTPSK